MGDADFSYQVGVVDVDVDAAGGDERKEGGGEGGEEAWGDFVEGGVVLEEGGEEDAEGGEGVEELTDLREVAGLGRGGRGGREGVVLVLVEKERRKSYHKHASSEGGSWVC